MLDRLLTIKLNRESDAVSRLGEAQREYDRLQAACRAQERKLADFGAWRQQEETRLYQEVHRQKLSRSGLDGYRQRISLLRSRELRLEDELADARQAVQAADAELEQSRRKRLDARREVIRFEEYLKRLKRVEKLREEHREETETEEAAAASFRAEPGMAT